MAGIMVAAGLVVLGAGATGLIEGSVRVARRLGVSPLVIGLTIVAWGTSMPELVVSTRAAATGLGDLALGNVVGSNLFNAAVILGLAAVITPLRVQSQLVRVETPLLIAVTAGVGLLALDGVIARWEGAVLFAGAIAFTVVSLRAATGKSAESTETPDAPVAPRPTWGPALGLVAGGLLLLVVGSELLTRGAVTLARGFGVGEALIGLTIIAAGTSLPELASTVAAAWRRQADIAVGNVVGSNLFNLLGILGITALVTPVATGALQLGDYVALGLVTLLIWPVMASGLRVQRGEGLLLLLAYAVYLYTRWPATG